MSRRVIIVVRQLKGHAPVAFFVKEAEVERSVVATDDFLEIEADKVIEDFKEAFVEFENATFYKYILDL